MKPYLKRAWAEISLSALEKNIRAIKSTLFRETSLMAVIKANAYGHGEDGILKKLCECGVKYFAVSNLDEAVSVRSHCPEGEILILGYTPPEFADELVENNIIQGVLSLDMPFCLTRQTTVAGFPWSIGTLELTKTWLAEVEGEVPSKIKSLPLNSSKRLDQVLTLS